MRRHHLSLTVALCMSLGVHAWAIHALIKEGAGNGRLDAAMSSPTKAHSAINKPIPIEVVQLPKREALPKELEQEFGQSDGRGDAINSMQGDKPLQAKLAPEEQAILSRQPGEHREGQLVQPKQAISARHGEAASGGNLGAAQKMLAALMPHEPPAAQMLGVTESTVNSNEGKEKIESLNHRSIESIKGAGAAKLTQVEKENAHASKAQPLRKAVLAAGNGGGPVAGQAGKSEPTLAGDPGEKSESESDAFSHVGGAVFQAGRLEARFGRKVKTVRPNFSLGGRMDLMNMFDPSMQLEVHADSQGKPTDVEVIQSSGSNNVDEPVRLAMYRWWFEPPKDQQGKPMPDVMVWTISFR